ncbi:MAG: hypothetical protein ACWA5U_04580 [bacterium]
MFITIQINKIYPSRILKNTPRLSILVLLGVLSSTASLIPLVPNVHAETRFMSPESSTLFSIKTPTRGMTMQQVRQTFGQPLQVTRSQGRVKKDWPRIICWDYKDFAVYFERKIVLHSVLKPNI